MQNAEKQFAKTRSEADKLKLETAQADYDNMVRNLKSVTKAAGDTEKAISKIEDTATGSSNAFSGIVGAIAQIRIEISYIQRDLITVIFYYQISLKPLKTLSLSQVSFPLLFPLYYIVP